MCIIYSQYTPRNSITALNGINLYLICTVGGATVKYYILMDTIEMHMASMSRTSLVYVFVLQFVWGESWPTWFLSMLVVCTFLYYARYLCV
jgi:hypothetical protein